MFNGIIFNQGKIKKIEKQKKGINLFLKSKLKFFFETGTFGNKSSAQDDNSYLGKVLLIDLNG